MLYVPIGTVWRWSQLALAITIMLIEYICRGVLVTMYNLIPNFGIFARIPNPLSFSTSPLSDEELDFERTTAEMVRARGYPCEEHFTTTADGFILGLHRVPRGRVAMDGATPLENHTSTPTTSSSPRPAVLILHGFMQCSETWVCRRDPQNSLPLFLADAGCDVWLGNNRGNKYSHKHLRYNPNQEEFWDFSLDDVVRYDVPAMVDYVLAKNGGRNLILIGFSQGTAQLWASLSSNPVLSPKVSLFIALAPVSTVKGFSNPLIDSIARTRPDFITLLFGRRAFLPLTLFWRKVLPRDKFVEVIDYSCNFLFGWNTACIDPTEKKILYSHIYSFSSVKAVVHWFQIIQTGRFQMFDQSLLIHTPRNVNWADTPPTHYHTHVMPAYQPSLITCPVALYYGGNDNLPNTEALLRSLPKNLVMEVHREPEYEHLDFMWASDVGVKIYPKILKVIEDSSRKAKFS